MTAVLKMSDNTKENVKQLGYSSQISLTEANSILEAFRILSTIISFDKPAGNICPPISDESNRINNLSKKMLIKKSPRNILNWI